MMIALFCGALLVFIAACGRALTANCDDSASEGEIAERCLRPCAAQNPAPRVTCGKSVDGQYFRDWPLRQVSAPLSGKGYGFFSVD
jgi:hypothetical protein